MEVLGGETEPRQLVHGSAVIVIAAGVGTEIKITDGRGVLLDAGQLRHVRGCLLVAHVNGIPVLLAEDTVHIIAALIATIICLGAAHLHLMLQDLRHHAGLRAVVNRLKDLRYCKYLRSSCY